MASGNILILVRRRGYADYKLRSNMVRLRKDTVPLETIKNIINCKHVVRIPLVDGIEVFADALGYFTKSHKFSIGLTGKGNTTYTVYGTVVFVRKDEITGSYKSLTKKQISFLFQRLSVELTSLQPYEHRRNKLEHN